MAISGYLKCKSCGSIFERNCTDPELTFFLRLDKCDNCGRRHIYGYFAGKQDPDFWAKHPSKVWNIF